MLQDKCDARMTVAANGTAESCAPELRIAVARSRIAGGIIDGVEALASAAGTAYELIDPVRRLFAELCDLCAQPRNLAARGVLVDHAFAGGPHDLGLGPFQR